MRAKIQHVLPVSLGLAFLAGAGCGGRATTVADGGHAHDGAQAHDVGLGAADRALPSDGGLVGDAGRSTDARPDHLTSRPAVGAACASPTSCPAGGSGRVVCLTSGYPGGYCSVSGCSGHGHDCPSDPGLNGTPGGDASKCVSLSGKLQCMRLCRDPADCGRTGYTCGLAQDGAGHGSVKVCLPTG